MSSFFLFFFFNATSTTVIYTLSLHDALPIYFLSRANWNARFVQNPPSLCQIASPDNSLGRTKNRSEEHTSELQSHSDLVCRLLLEKKKKKKRTQTNATNSANYLLSKSARLMR